MLRLQLRRLLSELVMLESQNIPGSPHRKHRELGEGLA